jgi:hypothetical protein
VFKQVGLDLEVVALFQKRFQSQVPWWRIPHAMLPYLFSPNAWSAP